MMASYPGRTYAYSRAAGADSAKLDQFGISADGLRRDLTTGGQDGERPTWPLSAYGPGIKPPRQLIEGAIEVSPEEMRVQYYIAQSAGNVQEYVQKEQALSVQMDQQIQKILSDVEGAKKYVADGQHQHPNRNDLVVNPGVDFPRSSALGTQNSSFGQPGTFGAPGNPASSNKSPFGAAAPVPSGFGGSAFGQPSGMGTQKSAFGAPSAIGASTGFGQTSALGSAATGFGKPAVLGGGGGSAFGQASSLTTNSPFGGARKSPAFGQPSQPSAFGSSPFATAQNQQPAFGQSAFGQTSKPAAFGTSPQPAFGQTSAPSAFGTPAFGQPSQPSAFGQPSQPSASAAVGTQTTSGASFGQPSGFAAAANTPSPFATAASSQTQSKPPSNATFGQPSMPSAFGAPAKSASPFASSAAGTPAFGQNSFGQSSTPAPNPFGKSPTPAPSAFGQPSASAPSPFGRPSAPTPNPFGQSSQPKPTAFGQTSQPQSSGFGGLSLGGAVPASSPAPNGLTGSSKPAHWKDQRNIVRDRNGKPTHYEAPDATGATKLVRIWFPDGAPQAQNPLIEAKPEMYLGELGLALQDIYDHVRQTGTFKGGIVPEIPPRTEWAGYDI